MCQVLYGHTFSTPLGKYQRVWTYLYGKSMFNFERNQPSVCPKVSVPFCIFTSNEWVPIAPHPCQYLLSVFWILHSNRCVVISHCFNLHFSDDRWYGTSFHVLIYTVHGILQARILEGVAVPFSRGSSQPRDRTHITGGFFTSWTTREMYST